MKKSESTSNKYSALMQTMSLFATFCVNILGYDFKYKH